MPLRGESAFLVVLSALVAAAIAGGIWAIGSPADARVRQEDARRIADLQDIQRAIDLRWTWDKTLPDSLASLRQQSEPPVVTQDPFTARSYEYRALAADRYELCAEFAESSTAPDTRPRRDFWSHGAGRHCYTLQARSF